MSIHELRVSYAEREVKNGSNSRMAIKNGRDVVALMAPLLEPEVVEVCYVLCLTTTMDLIAYHQLSRGTINTALVHPREVYQTALLANAATIVLAHNHPSGAPTPSDDDLEVTRNVKQAGQLLGIELLDHVVIGHGGRYVSIREQGRL